jgi:broad specificity phosphatase PhoE
MARVTLVRHGRATAGWDDHPDPGLDDIGRAQAEAVGELLARGGLAPIHTSPMRRCQETARPLARRWNTTPIIDSAVSEIPSPVGVPEGERVEWLRDAMLGTWPDLGADYVRWRDGVVAAVGACADGTVIVSHFVAINAVIGAALGDDRVLIRSLDNCSRTVVETTVEGLVLIEGGAEADTLIR